MKKIYLTVLALGAFTLSMNSQVLIDQNFDGLEIGPISAQDPDNFRPWDNDLAADPSVSVSQSQSGAFSLLISDNTTDDVILQLAQPGNSLTSGTYTLNFDHYIPTDARGFYGFLTADEAAGTFSTSVRIGEPTLGDVITQAPTPAGFVVVGGPFDFPRDQWVAMSHVINLDDDTIVIKMNGEEIYNGDFLSEGNLTGVDLWSIDDTSTAYYDNIVFAQGLLGTDDFSADVFSVYPNPVKDVLNIQSKTSVDSVVVYDILGKVVISTRPDTISPSIDMSGLTSGAYMVNVTIGGASKTVKVIK